MPLSSVKSSKTNKTLAIKHKIALALVCLAVGVLIYIISYFGMSQQSGLGVLNQPTLSWMLGQRENTLTVVAKIITTVANPIVIAPFVGFIVIIWAFFKREILRPVLLAGSMMIAAILSTTLKAIIHDPRPSQTDMIPMFETDFSFPSGHTIAIAVFLLVLGYLIYSRNFSVKRILIWVSAFFMGTTLIALTRLYLGYHWLTDVVASVGLALIILAFVIFLDAIVRRFSLNTDRYRNY